MSADLRVMQLLAGTGPILLDFDGPVCQVFSGYPAPLVADELRILLAKLRADGIEEIAGEPDPLKVLLWSATLGRPSLVRAAENALCAAELRAVESAKPTAYAREVIVTARQNERPVAIVSNNSAPAIAAYLAVHRISRHIGTIVGRTFARPERMKPNPEPIIRAVSELHADRRECLMVGDSLSDIAGAQAAGVRIIGYANKPAKVTLFEEAGADVVMTSMLELAKPLLEEVSR